MRDPILPAHIQETIQEIAELHARHHRQATPIQRVVERAVRWVGRPRFVGLLTGAIAFWVLLNLALFADGRAFDPPPFQILQNVGGLIALYITVLILITAQREKEIGEHREQLILELAILNDQKSAKLIQLMEELRRDDPHISDRLDREAVELSVPVNPQAVLEAIKETHQEMLSSVGAGARAPARTEGDGLL